MQPKCQEEGPGKPLTTMNEVLLFASVGESEITGNTGNTSRLGMKLLKVFDKRPLFREGVIYPQNETHYSDSECIPGSLHTSSPQNVLL